MKVEYLAPAIMDVMHRSGVTVKIYDFLYKDRPKNFALSERAIFPRLEKLLLDYYEDNHIDISYDTWADLVIRTYVDIRILSAELVQLLLDFVKNKAPDHYLSCVVQDLSLDAGGIYGSFGFNNSRFLVDEGMKEVWIEKVGEGTNWTQWNL